MHEKHVEKTDRLYQKSEGLYYTARNFTLGCPISLQ